MKHTALIALALAAACAAMPAASQAQTLAQNAPARQAIMELEYQLTDPGVSPDRVAGYEQRVAQLEAQANGNEVPALPVPAYGSCDADRETISYLQDQLNVEDLDYQQTVIDKRAIYDLGVNLKQRHC